MLGQGPRNVCLIIDLTNPYNLLCVVLLSHDRYDALRGIWCIQNPIDIGPYVFRKQCLIKVRDKLSPSSDDTFPSKHLVCPAFAFKDEICANACDTNFEAISSRAGSYNR